MASWAHRGSDGGIDGQIGRDRALRTNLGENRGVAIARRREGEDFADCAQPGQRIATVEIALPNRAHTSADAQTHFFS